MVYKKIAVISFIIAIILGVVSGVVFASSDITSNDKIYDTGLKILVFIQKYSWPVVILILIYALYQFYVIGSENLEKKVVGQRLIVGVTIFTALIQALPLCYAFIVTAQI